MDHDKVTEFLGRFVADLGCRLGSSSVLLAQAYPRTTVVGSDYHAESIGLARKQAAEAGVGDRVEDNLHPVGRLYYSSSTFLCVPNALSQPGGYALGAQAGETATRQMISEAGFTRFRRAAQSPFNLVYEVRP